jgi:hypothetical protein
MDGGGNSGGVHTSWHELKEGHLSGCILAGYPLERTTQQTELRVGRKTRVRSKLQIASSSNNVLAVGVVEMSVDNLLGEGQWSLQSR